MTNETTNLDLDAVDFDDWDETKEQEALKAAARSAKCRHIIGGDCFIGRFPDGTKVKLPLRLSLADIEEITRDDTDSVTQFTRVLEKVGGRKTADTIAKQPTTSMIDMANSYFTAYQKINELVLEK